MAQGLDEDEDDEGGNEKITQPLAGRVGSSDEQAGDEKGRNPGAAEFRQIVGDELADIYGELLAQIGGKILQVLAEGRGLIQIRFKGALEVMFMEEFAGLDKGKGSGAERLPADGIIADHPGGQDQGESDEGDDGDE